MPVSTKLLRLCLVGAWQLLTGSSIQAYSAANFNGLDVYRVPINYLNAAASLVFLLFMALLSETPHSLLGSFLLSHETSTICVRLDESKKSTFLNYACPVPVRALSGACPGPVRAVSGS